MKRTFTFAIMLIIVMALVACGGTGAPTGTAANTEVNSSAGSSESGTNPLAGKLVCYCPPTLGDTFLASIAEITGKYCEEKGMTFNATEGEFNITTQIQQTENFIAMGADLIICQPVDVSAMETVTKTARDRGIKIMFLADDPLFDCDGEFMSVDSVQGQMVAEMGSKWIDDTFPDAKDGEIKVAILGQNDRPASLERCDAIHDTIVQDSRCSVVFEKYGLDSTAVSAQTAMDECLAMYRDINLVLCFDENCCIGANASVMADSSLDLTKIACFGGNITDTGYTMVDQSKTGESVIRGLVTFGPGESYYQSMADAIEQILLDEVPENTAFFCAHETYNSVGYESTFDPVAYSASYVDLHY